MLRVLLSICLIGSAASCMYVTVRNDDPLTQNRKELILKTVREKTPPTDYFKVLSVNFEDTVDQWAPEKNDWEQRLMFKVEFDFKKNNAVQERTARVVLYLKKDSVHNTVILPRGQ